MLGDVSENLSWKPSKFNNLGGFMARNISKIKCWLLIIFCGYKRVSGEEWRKIVKCFIADSPLNAQISFNGIQCSDDLYIYKMQPILKK